MSVAGSSASAVAEDLLALECIADGVPSIAGPLDPPGSGSLIVTPAMDWTRLIVWAAAAMVAGVVVARFRAAGLRDRLRY